jgi:RND family efflux transporter MFP subunit
VIRRSRLAYACAAALAAAGVVIGAGAWLARGGIAGAAARRNDPLYYVDPMHPAYRSDKPGTAPDCGMALVPVYTAEGHQAGDDGVMGSVVHMDTARQQLIGARVIVAQRTAGRHSLRLYARVVPDETRTYKVNVGMDGFIRELSNVTTGSLVKKGQWLATFSAPESRTAIQSYVVAVDAAARARAAGDGADQLEVASAGIQQAEDRLLNIGMSPAQIQSLGQTRAMPAGIQIAAPGDGLVLQRSISAGERFERGAELYRIADLRRVWIEAGLFGIAAEYVRPGMNAEVRVPGRAAVLHARVTHAVPEFDASSQSFAVRLDAENPGLVLRPGMFVDVMLALDLPEAIAIPADAVIDAGLEKRVFVERKAGVFEPRQVETGWRFGGTVEILNGLVEGDRVVVSGSFLLDSESRMRQSRAHPAGGK